MFAIFKNDSLLNFWANQAGDIFLESTIRGLRLEHGEIDLNYYFGIYAIPEFYEFDQGKKLIVKKQVITIEEVESVNELGETVVNQNEIVTYEIEKIIEPVVYFAKGLMVKNC